MHESVLFWGLLKAQAAFPQYGKLACVPTDKIAWRRHRAPIEEEPEINHKALLLLLYPVAARAANLHSGTPGPIDRCSAAHPAPPPPRPRAESKIFASERPEGVPGGGGGGARGSRARAEAQLRKHALTVGRLIPPNVTCAKRPPESLLWRRPLIFQTTFNPSVNSKKFEIKFSFVGFLPNFQLRPGFLRRWPALEGSRRCSCALSDFLLPAIAAAARPGVGSRDEQSPAFNHRVQIFFGDGWTSWVSIHKTRFQRPCQYPSVSHILILR